MLKKGEKISHNFNKKSRFSQVQWILVRYIEICKENGIEKDEIKKTQFIQNKVMIKSDQVKQKYEEIICINDEKFEVIEKLNEEIRNTFKQELKIENFKRFKKGDFYPGLNAKDNKIYYSHFFEHGVLKPVNDSNLFFVSDSIDKVQNLIYDQTLTRSVNHTIGKITLINLYDSCDRLPKLAK